jgi:hypothetical protein
VNCGSLAFRVRVCALAVARRVWLVLSVRTAITESVNLYETPGRGFYRVVASVCWGGLIQELAGISGGSGGPLANRSGWAA